MKENRIKLSSMECITTWSIYDSTTGRLAHTVNTKEGAAKRLQEYNQNLQIGSLDVEQKDKRRT